MWTCTRLPESLKHELWLEQGGVWWTGEDWDLGGLVLPQALLLSSCGDQVSPFTPRSHLLPGGVSYLVAQSWLLSMVMQSRAGICVWNLNCHSEIGRRGKEAPLPHSSIDLGLVKIKLCLHWVSVSTSRFHFLFELQSVSSLNLVLTYYTA